MILNFILFYHKICLPRCSPEDVTTFGSGLINPRRLCLPGDVCCTKPKPSYSNQPLTGTFYNQKKVITSNKDIMHKDKS